MPYDLKINVIIRYQPICLAPASFAQTRIWLDERIRFNSDHAYTAIYNMPYLYRLLPQHSLSIQQLKIALYIVTIRHESLRTAIVFDEQNNQLIQKIVDARDANDRLFPFIQDSFENDEQLNFFMYDEKRNSQLFHLEKGLVLRCHILRHCSNSSNNSINDKDAIIFNFHHAVFDSLSMNIFLRDLNQAYSTGELLTSDDITLRYLDCKYRNMLFKIRASLFSFIFL